MSRRNLLVLHAWLKTLGDALQLQMLCPPQPASAQHAALRVYIPQLGVP